MRILLFLAFSGSRVRSRLRTQSLALHSGLGYYWSQAKPALRIKSGDTVQDSDHAHQQPGPPRGQRHQRRSDRKGAQGHLRRGQDKGPGGHILTGPIFVEGAEPGDTLEVRIRKIDLSIPYAYNSFSPQRGVLTRRTSPRAPPRSSGSMKKRGVAKFADKIEIPCAPLRQHGCRAARNPWAASTAVLPTFLRRQLGQQGSRRRHHPLHSREPRPARSSKWATATRGREMAKSISPRMETSLVGTLQFIVRKT